MREPSPRSRGPLLRPVHGGLATGTGWRAHRRVAHGRYVGRELAVETPRKRGDRGEPHRGRRWAAREWGEAGDELQRWRLNSSDAWQLGARKGGAKWGKALRGKWPRWWHLL
jgi:hypothetical protein